ncbi:MAG: hypothetical protein IPP14_05245 [Planctomycetes bacterium]|nr:hypothetical protein [Planctomycetota bacterium]
MEKLFKHHGKDVAFLFVYTREAHPDDGPEDRRQAEATGGWKIKGNAVKIDKHASFKDRVKAAKELKEAGKKGWRILVDDMKDTNQKTFASLPNMAFLVDPLGAIKSKWAWTASSTSDKIKRNGDENTDNVYTVLKDAGDLTRYSVADDPQLPLRDLHSGEWLKYGDKIVSFEPASTGKYKRDDALLELPAFTPAKTRAEVTAKELTLGKLKLPCVVVTQGDRETWYCTRLPGDGIARVVTAGKVTLDLADAGFEKDKSALVAYDPAAK